MKYHNILNTDQSHRYIDSLSPKESLERLHSHNKMEGFDRFDREIYPPATEVVRADSLRYRRELEQM